MILRLAKLVGLLLCLAALGQALGRKANIVILLAGDRG